MAVRSRLLRHNISALELVNLSSIGWWTVCLAAPGAALARSPSYELMARAEPEWAWALVTCCIVIVLAVGIGLRLRWMHLLGLALHAGWWAGIAIMIWLANPMTPAPGVYSALLAITCWRLYEVAADRRFDG
jgi:mannose/fructose/N-acetylgalactosamine-specific phosphotransferase system component IIC